MKLENWQYKLCGDYKYKLCGEVYGSERFQNGEFICLSEARQYISKGHILRTNSGSEYILGKCAGDYIKQMQFLEFEIKYQCRRTVYDDWKEPKNANRERHSAS